MTFDAYDDTVNVMLAAHHIATVAVGERTSDEYAWQLVTDPHRLLHEVAEAFLSLDPAADDFTFHTAWLADAARTVTTFVRDHPTTTTEHST